MTRISRTAEGWRLGPGPGRGAYWCGGSTCRTEIIRKGRLARALRTTLNGQDLEALRALLPESSPDSPGKT
ncbi:MAG: YlxR family protein [Fimbriimonadaceae bacterium]|nr:YlxR family protein [Fimbriimonadaceae bacterium]